MRNFVKNIVCKLKNVGPRGTHLKKKILEANKGKKKKEVMTVT